jgi:hypothetical protein
MATKTYMGVCRLPAKESYFPGYRFDVFPQHPQIKIKQPTFDYLLRYFHTSSYTERERFVLLPQKLHANITMEE